MTVTLNKEAIQACAVVYQKYSRITAETDVNVPDINPDILKVLDVSGNVSVSEKSVHSGKVFIRGKVSMTVLYTPDGDTVSKVKCLTAEKEFTHTVDAGSHDDNLRMSAEIEPESFNYTLINSRKLSLRCVLGADIKLSRPEEFEISTSVGTDENICTRSRRLRLCSNPIISENRISICEQYELPSDKPSVSEILKTSVFPQSLEFTLMEGKALAKGEARVCTVYTSVDDGAVCFTEHTLPFSELLDINGAEEDMEGEIDYSVSDIYSEVRDDSDGEPRIIGLDFGLSASVRGHKIYEPEILCDAYSLNGTANITSSTKVLEQLVDNTTAQLTHKFSIQLPDAFPEILQLCDINAAASVSNISVENGGIIVTGSIIGNIIYLSNDESMPLCSFTDTSEFTHTIAAPNISGDSVCEAKVFVEHISYTINGGRAIELRVVLGICVRSYINEEIPIITDIDVEDDTNTEPKACIVIYFVKAGDSLCSIAKKYRTTVEALMECNNLSSDSINVGQQIRICRSA